LEGEQEPLTQVEEMAAHHVREIRRVQPAGPYFLGGLSLGGLVAFEIAQQLHSQEQTVALLVLLDTHRPTRHRLVYAWRHRLRRLFIEECFGRLVFHGRNFLQLGAAQRSTYAREKTRRLGKRIAAKLRLDHQGIQAHLGDSYAVKVRKANIQAAQEYRPDPYRGTITLLMTSDSPGRKQDGRRGWGQLALGGLDVHVVPGDHSTMISETHIDALTTRLRDCLQRAQANPLKAES